jgi:VIT1/CCC1 family predicted Fe2+/Mn2+ transporter
MAGAARDVAPRSALTRLAWALCVLSVALALAGVALAAVNGKGPADLITDHHAIGILTTLVVAPVGALIVVGDRRHLLA